MDAIALGALFRLVRVHRRLRQREVASRAGVSDGIVSRIEHGQLSGITHGTIDRVAAALEIRLDHRARWHAGDLDRLAARDHGLLVESIADRLRAMGWQALPEVTFSIRADHGAVDLLAWRPGSCELLVVEVKTEVTDVGETLRRLGTKVRRAREIASSVGWAEVSNVSAALIVADTRTNHRRVAAHRETFRAAFPDTGRQLGAFLAGHRPGPLRALAYVPYQRFGTTRRPVSGVQRVRGPRRAAGPTVPARHPITAGRDHGE